ncbi:MAG: glycosyltransferase [Candidatus Muiribacterium halophilum]|uniref:Glycosyltransferase n=1 Tax=Muiribacterium halophilum TaxID=2053465 RepID=A0A2N5ZG16_MUIH1|nr:MAG: glycosyltransferase [Candidatus Muirbacterium halophilum]
MISVVVPVYNEEENISKVIDEIILIRDRLEKIEIIVVDDGSCDNTVEVVRKKQIRNDIVRLISVKHSGQTRAFRIGIDNSIGDKVVLIDGDFQNSALDIPLMINKLNEFDAVLGYRKNRKDPVFFKIIPSKIANIILSWIFDFKVYDYGCSLKVFKRETIDKVKIHLVCEGMHRFIPFFANIYTKRIIQIAVSHRKREKGISKNGLERIPTVIYHMLTLKAGNLFPVPNIKNGIVAIFIILTSFVLFLIDRLIFSGSFKKLIKDTLYLSFGWLYYNFVLDIINTRKNYNKEYLN